MSNSDLPKGLNVDELAAGFLKQGNRVPQDDAERSEYQRLLHELAVINPHALGEFPLEVGRLIFFPHVTDPNEMLGILENINTYFSENRSLPDLIIADRQILTSVVRTLPQVRSQMNIEVICPLTRNSDDPRRAVCHLASYVRTWLQQRNGEKKARIGVLIQADLIGEFLAELCGFELPTMPLLSTIFVEGRSRRCPHCHE